LKVALLKANSRKEDSLIILEKLPVVIGRDPECEIQLEDIWVSPHHCMIEQVCGAVMVLDLAARTGTFLNGRRVRKAVLSAGDRLTVGRTHLLVRFLDSSAAPAPAAQGATV